MPHRNQPELEAMRKAVFAALEVRDEADILHGMDRGELEARVLQGERARAAARPTSAASYGSPRKPKPTTPGTRTVPMPASTRPPSTPRSAGRHSASRI
jgi:hypothetical protein